MTTNTDYNTLLALAKTYLAAYPSIGKRMDAEEIANTAWILIETGAVKAKGDMRYAIMKACDPRRRDNVHARPEGLVSSYDTLATPFEDMVSKHNVDWVELYDEIDNLPYEQSQAVLGHLHGDDVNQRDLKAGQKAMRDIYGK